MRYYDLDNLPSLTPPETGGPGARRTARYDALSFILTFMIMMGVWVVLSGKLDAFHLGLGALCSALTAWLSRDFLFTSGSLKGLGGISLRFIGYLPWLIYQIILANIHVLKLSFTPDLEKALDPHIIRIRSRLKTDMSLVTLANSITLTPGTITIYASTDGELTVHALDRVVGDVGGIRAMEIKVAQTFGEK